MATDTDFSISPNPLLNINPAWDFIDTAGIHTHKLQPYRRQRSGADPKCEIREAPAFKPQEFHHGVMISKGNDLYWGHAFPGLDEFGTSKISIVSPNAIYVQGDFNTVPHLVKGKIAPEMKLTPCAVIGDSITLLSNNWSPTLFQVDGLIATPTSLNGGGYLTMPNFGPPATSTTYNCALVTNNMPTTKDRVMENQSAAFGDLLFLLENWGGKNLDYFGSLVVLDQWRYTRSFLLDAPKIHGTSPFGYTSEGADPQWLNTFVAAGKGPLNTSFPIVPDWYSAVPQVYYTPASRSFTFNEDFLTAAGTPPFTPFGITASGVGSWMRVMR